VVDENFKIKGAANIENPVLSKPRSASVKLDSHHNFNEIIDNYAGDATSFKIPTKNHAGNVVRTSELRQIEGSLNGKDGIFEWIIDQNKVTHRRFIPGGKITGMPNQKI
jgi:filamentous hemagglutinin